MTETWATCAFCLMLAGLREHAGLDEQPAVTVINGHAACERHIRFAVDTRGWDMAFLKAHEWEMEKNEEAADRRWRERAWRS